MAGAVAQKKKWMGRCHKWLPATALNVGLSDSMLKLSLFLDRGRSRISVPIRTPARGSQELASATICAPQRNP